jgi:tRNA (mo5U34)-methyltransferase
MVWIEDEHMSSGDQEEILAKINAASWYHRFELLPGIMTPGRVNFDPGVVFRQYELPHDLTGKKVLDVGTLDGVMAFAAEARGADVTALDIQDPNKTAFNIAKGILGSRVRYVQGSVYDAGRLLTDQYDYIFFLGVFYHLKHPVLALEQLHGVQPEGGKLIFEGECLLNHWEDIRGQAVAPDILRALSLSDVPIAAFYSGTFKGDDTNWFIPNPACLRGWFQAAGYKVIIEKLHDFPPNQRIGGIAQTVSAAPIEHRVF